jgi:glucan phosphorylase
VSLYLLDTNIAANTRAEDRDLTDQLYGGDRETCIRQEILLGIGGYRMLQKLGIQLTVLQMNEGHAAFAALEHIRHLHHIPRKWVERMKACVHLLCGFVNTHRMVRDYCEDYYIGAHARFRALDENRAERARRISAALDRIRSDWQDAWVRRCGRWTINAQLLSLPPCKCVPTFISED